MSSTSSHPELFLSRTEWEALSDKLKDPFFKQLHENNLEALRLLELDKGNDITDVPVRLGRGGLRCTIPERVLKKRVVRAVPAWYITKDERYLRIAWDSIAAACASHEWHPEPANGLRSLNLPASELLYTIAFGFDALHPFLTDTQKTLCIETLRDVGLPAYLRGLELKDWWENCDFNWGAAMHGNAGLAALAIRHEEPELAAHVLREVKPRLRTVINSYYPDGGYTEGVMYLVGCICWLTDFVIPLLRLTGDDLGLLTNKDFHDTIHSRLFLEGSDGRPYNFSNVDAGTNEWGLSHIFWWADKLKRPEWALFEQENLRDWRDAHGCAYDIECFWLRAPFQPVAPYDTSGVRHFTGIDWMTWKGEKSWLAFRSGFNGGNHNNKDLGHFILGYGTERFLVDPGYGAAATNQHNAVTIRGQQQTDAATARITKMEPFERGFQLVCDLTQAFPHSLQHFRRHVLMLDDQHLLVLDDIRGRGPRPQSAMLRTSAHWHLQTRLPWRQEGKDLIIQGLQSRLKIVFLSEIGFLKSSNWEKDGPVTTLTWRHSYDRNHDIHPMLLTFGNPKLSYQWRGNDLDIEIDGQRSSFNAERGELNRS